MLIRHAMKPLISCTVVSMQATVLLLSQIMWLCFIWNCLAYWFVSVAIVKEVGLWKMNWRSRLGLGHLMEYVLFQAVHKKQKYDYSLHTNVWLSVSVSTTSFHLILLVECGKGV